MATYKERMENLKQLKDSYNFTPQQIFQMTSYKVGQKNSSSTSGESKITPVHKSNEAEQARKLKILEYLKKARSSAISRGVYNQNIYSKIEAEAEKNA